MEKNIPTRSNRVQLIVFDVDGTLLDTERIWKESLGAVGLEYNIPGLDTSLFPRLIGISGEAEERIYKEVLDDSIRDDLVSRWRALAFKRMKSYVPVKKGAKEIFEWAKHYGLKIGVATQTNRKDTEYRLKKVGLYPYVDHLICGDDVEHKKPHPEIYLRMLEYFHLDAQAALVIEDSPTGIESAYRAGIPVIQVPDQLQPTDKQREQTVAICSDLLDVQNWISR